MGGKGGGRGGKRERERERERAVMGRVPPLVAGCSKECGRGIVCVCVCVCVS